MNNFQSRVLEFQRASGQPVQLKRELTKEELDFRDSLLREEIRELTEAIIDGDRVEILDALCDIKYVNDGTANMIGVYLWDEHIEQDYDSIIVDLNMALEVLYSANTSAVNLINEHVYLIAHGFKFSLDTFKTALTRVHESNMSKFCNDIKTAERTQEFYAKQGINTTIEPREKKFVVYREGDVKVLKSVEYFPVYLNDLV